MTETPTRQELRRRVPDLARLPITVNRRAIAPAEGVRAALSVAAIVAVTEVLGLPILREAALAAILTCLGDPGGPIRHRVPALCGFAALGAVITTAGGLARAVGPAAALPFGLAGLFCLAFARVWGQNQQQLGVLLNIVLVLSLDYPRAPGEAALIGMSFAGGAAWAIMLTLVIWPLYPFAEARRAVADSYRALSLLAGDLAAKRRGDDPDPATLDTHARVHRRAVREAIEAARAIVLETVRARGAGGNRAAQTLIRLEAADQVFGTLIGLAELPPPAEPAARAANLRFLRRLGPLLRLFADLIERDAPAPDARIERFLAAMAADAALQPPDGPARSIMAATVERLRMALTLSRPNDYMPGIAPGGERVPFWQRVWRPLGANLTWRSPSFRHAVRLTVTAGPALALTMLFPSAYGHWLTITLIGTMQPFFALTFARAIERVVGTALGGVLAAAVGLVCTTPISIALAMFPLAVIALTVRRVSLGLFVTAFTPLVVLLVETGIPGAAEWSIAAARAVLTTFGGAVAVAACFLLWPNRQPEFLWNAAKAAIAAHGVYGRSALSNLLGEASIEETARARVAAGLASNALETSLGQALTEPHRRDPDRLEAMLVVSAALRRVAGRIAVMRFDPSLRATVPPDALRTWRDWIQTTMQALAAGSTAPPPRPGGPDADALRRVARQIELIAGVLPRLLA
jgi:uncharacterized membrane protein YccC